MKWRDNIPLDAPIRPYDRSRCKLTDINCQIDARHQAQLYAWWCREKGQTHVHTFPFNRRSPYSVACHEGLAAAGPHLKLIEVSMEDYI